MGDARHRDAEDPLAGFREKFHLPTARHGRDPVYLCGNSLGLMPRSAAERVASALDNWRRLAVRGHFDGDEPWLDYHSAARNTLAALCGARPREVVAMNTLTVNLHLLLASFYRPSGQKRAIVVEAGAFPSDRYAAASQIAWHGNDPTQDLLEWAPNPDSGLLELDTLTDLIERHHNRIAVLLLPGVQYATGQALPLGDIAALAKRHELVLGVDLAHAIGNVEMDLHEQAIDFAVWCSYKYLNGGPGAVAGAYVHERYHDDPDLPRLEGWWGNREATRFLMRERFEAAPGADAWQMSNPPILALAPVLASLDIFADATLPRLRQKSVALTGYLEALLRQHFANDLRIVTPGADSERGCQLSLTATAGAAQSRELHEQLERSNVIGDWREPDIIRIAPTPLYNRYSDAVAFCQRVDEILDGPATPNSD